MSKLNIRIAVIVLATVLSAAGYALRKVAVAVTAVVVMEVVATAVVITAVVMVAHISVVAAIVVGISAPCALRRWWAPRRPQHEIRRHAQRAELSCAFPHARNTAALRNPISRSGRRWCGDWQAGITSDWKRMVATR